MTLLTFTSDFGNGSHYTAAARGSLLSAVDSLQIIDINHNIKPCDINAAAFELEYSYKAFPRGTIHLVAVDSLDRLRYPEIVIMELKGHFFISYNSGLLSLIDPLLDRAYYKMAGFSKDHFQSVQLCFSKVFCLMLEDGFFDQQPTKADDIHTKDHFEPVVEEGILQGRIRYIDQRGIAFTNIHISDYTVFIGNASPKIRLTKHDVIRTIHNHLLEVESGDVGCYFNSNGILCIGFYQDDTREMLALNLKTPIRIERV